MSFVINTLPFPALRTQVPRAQSGGGVVMVEQPRGGEGMGAWAALMQLKNRS